MTLKENFRKMNLSTWISRKDVEKLESIADEFAIDFAEWILCQDITVRAVGIYIDGRGIYKTTDELLEIYKKEKGL